MLTSIRRASWSFTANRLAALQSVIIAAVDIDRLETQQLGTINRSPFCFSLSLVSISARGPILSRAELDTLRIRAVQVGEIEIYFLSLECFASRLGLAAAAAAAVAAAATVFASICLPLPL